MTRKLDFYFRFLWPLEFCCSLRFITFPVVLIRLFGSPRFMNFPLMLWAFVYYGTMFAMFLSESMVTAVQRRICKAQARDQNLVDAEYTETRHSEASLVADGDEENERGTAIEYIHDQPPQKETTPLSIAKRDEKDKYEENAMPSAPAIVAAGDGSEEMIVAAQPVAQSERAMQLATVESEDEYTLYFSGTVVATSLFIVNFIDLMVSFFHIIVSLILAFGIFSQSNFGSNKNLDPAWRTEYYLTSTGLYLSVISIVQHLAMFFVVSPLGGACASTGLCRTCTSLCPNHEYDRGFRSWTLSKSMQSVHKSALVALGLFALTAAGFLFSYAHEARMRVARGTNVEYSGCEPMVDNGGDDSLCMYPFPSTHYLRVDSSTPTGFMVDVNSETTAPPIKRGGRLSFDFLTDNYYDGFSVTGSVLWYVPDFVDETEKADSAADQLVSETEVAPGWALSSLIIKNGTEELHPHFCQVDYLAAPTDNRACYCQPARALDYDAHYTVVIKGLVGASGARLPPSALLQSYISAYRAGGGVEAEGDDPERYDRFRSNVFPLLESKGVSLDDVQLAFDFHTLSYNSSTRMARSLHEMAAGKMEHAFGSDFDSSTGEGDISRVVQRVETDDTFSGGCDASTTDHGDTVAAYATYKVSVPWMLKNQAYVDVEVIDQLRGRGYANPYHEGRHTLAIDDYADMGLAEASLVVAVPCSIATGQVPLSGVVQWGHGLFADRTQAATEYLRTMANTEGWVLWGMDWRGFDRFGFPMLARQLVHDGGATINDVYFNLVQSFLSQISVRSFTMDKLLVNDRQYLDNYLQIGDSDRELVKAGTVPHHFMGGSMGAILGGGYMHAAGASRGVLYTPGAPFTFIVGRSSLFAAFLSAVDLQFYDRKSFRLALAMWQSVFDEAETATWSQADPVTQSLRKDVLLLAALGDSVVMETSTAIMSRNVNASLITPSVESISALPAGTTTDIEGTAYTSDRGTRALFLASYPTEAIAVRDNARGTPKRQPDNRVHSCFPTIDTAISMAKSFIEGTLVNDVDCGNADDSGCFLDDVCGS